MIRFGKEMWKRLRFIFGGARREIDELRLDVNRLQAEKLEQRKEYVGMIQSLASEISDLRSALAEQRPQAQSGPRVRTARNFREFVTHAVAAQGVKQ